MIKLLKDNYVFIVTILCILIMVYFGYQIIKPIIDNSNKIDESIYSFDIIGDYFK
jgi:hypothetical protein